MNAPIDPRILQAYLDQELNDEAAQGVEQKMRTDPAFAEYLREFQLGYVLQQAQWREEMRGTLRQGRRVWWERRFFLRAAAGLALLLAVVWLFRNHILPIGALPPQAWVQAPGDSTFQLTDPLNIAESADFGPRPILVRSTQGEYVGIDINTVPVYYVDGHQIETMDGVKIASMGEDAPVPPFDSVITDLFEGKKYNSVIARTKDWSKNDQILYMRGLSLFYNSRIEEAALVFDRLRDSTNHFEHPLRAQWNSLVTYAALLEKYRATESAEKYRLQVEALLKKVGAEEYYGIESFHYEKRIQQVKARLAKHGYLFSS